MAITIQQFRTRFPIFADTAAYPDDLLDDCIQEADRCINDDFFGDRADDARLYLTAHILTVTVTLAAQAGGVQSVTAGQASITYRTVASGEDDLESTGYGRQYRRLIKLIGGARAVV